MFLFQNKSLYSSKLGIIKYVSTQQIRPTYTTWWLDVEIIFVKTFMLMKSSLVFL